MTSIIIISLLGIATLFMGIFNLKRASIFLIIGGLAAALYYELRDWNTVASYYNNMISTDRFSVSFSILMIVSTVLLFLLCTYYYRNADKNITDIYGLILFSLVGGLLLVSYSNLAMLFLGIEILSIPLYILAGSNRSSISGNEASMKYFLMGSFASGIMLFGIALIYAAGHSFDLQQIRNALSPGNSLVTVGVLMILAGFLFKVSLVPFHFWAPDVYEGSPTVITAFMATVVKTAGFAAFLRLFQGSFEHLENVWYNVLWVVAAATLIVANVSALKQTGLKRLLAYSSISHAGYLLISILMLNAASADTMLYYSAAYAVSTIAAFAVLMAIKDLTGTDDIASIKGLYSKNPFLAFSMSVALLSLAGIPPMAGFLAKYYMLSEALEVNLFWLVMIALVNSAVGAYYYLRVIIAAYSGSDEAAERVPAGILYNSVIVLSLILTLAIGIFPDYVLGLLN